MALPLRIALQRALSKIGRSNGHSPQPGGSNLDPLMHYYLVDTEAEAFFKAQRRASRTEMFAALPEDASKKMNELITAAKRQKMGQPIAVVAASDRYTLNATTKKPAAKLNTTKLRNELMKDDRYTREEVSRLFKKCTEDSTPAQTIVAIPLFD